MDAQPHFYVKRSRDGQFYFVLTAVNGQTVSQSEMYETRAGALNGIESVKANAWTAAVVDQTQDEADA